MKRSYILLGSMLATAGGLSLAQCSGGGGTPDGGDGGGVDAKSECVGTKCTSNDSGPGTDADSGPVVTPVGKQLDAMDHMQIFGVTSDGFVVYADNGQTNGTAPLWVVSQTGGTPVKLASPAVSANKTYVVGISGKVVAIWQGVTTSTTAPQIGALSLSVSGGALVPVAPLSSPNAFAATTDGSHVMYSQNVTLNTGDIVGAKNDGTSLSTLVTGVDTGSNGCRPFIGFAGGVNAVTATCTAIPPDGGVPVATISSYSATWAATQIATNVLNFWATDTAGDKLLVATTSALSVYPIGSAVGVTVDSKNINNGDFTFGYMNKLGTLALYSTAAGELLTAPLTGPTGVDIQATGAKFIRTVSADENYIIYTTNFDSPTTPFGGDLYLTKTTAAATPTALVTGSTTGALFGLTTADNFTADSSHVMSIENLQTKLGIGDLYAMAVNGGTPAKITTNEWINLSATGTKIVFNDNCQNCSSTAGSAAGQADIKSVDVATTAAPTLLQAAADTDIYMATTKDHVIYAYSQNPASTGTPALGGNGLYSIAIP